jgi:hypothetical protein
MIESLILIEAKSSLPDEALRISLGNALQIVVGSVAGFGTILHIAADSADYLNKAIGDFSKIENVTSVITLIIRQQ